MSSDKLITDELESQTQEKMNESSFAAYKDTIKSIAMEDEPVEYVVEKGSTEILEEDNEPPANKDLVEARPKFVNTTSFNLVSYSSSSESESESDSESSSDESEVNSQSEKEDKKSQPQVDEATQQAKDEVDAKMKSMTLVSTVLCGTVVPDNQMPEVDSTADVTQVAAEVKTELIGRIHQIMRSKVVTVQGLEMKSALNIDSVLFKEDRCVLGKIADVFGPVNQPLYAVVMDNVEGLALGDRIYCVPADDKLTAFVLNSHELHKQKGSDASWIEDIEPPAGMIDYSDDEEERQVKRSRKKRPHPSNDQVNHSQANQTSNNYIPRMIRPPHFRPRQPLPLLPPPPLMGRHRPQMRPFYHPRWMSPRPPHRHRFPHHRPPPPM